MHATRITMTLALFVGWMGLASAQDTLDATHFRIEVQIVRVTTNISGNGLTSRTLPGLEGLNHVVHEKWGDVEFVMDGETLTWNGEASPDAPGIILLSNPRITTAGGKSAIVKMSDQTPLHFFEAVPGGLFALRSFEPVDGSGPGVELGVTPRQRSNEKGEIKLDFSFRVTTVGDREELEGVELNIGRPILQTTRSEGPVTVRDREWACYRTAVESRGYLYIFFQVTQQQPPEK